MKTENAGLIDRIHFVNMLKILFELAKVAKLITLIERICRAKERFAEPFFTKRVKKSLITIISHTSTVLHLAQ